MKALLVTGLVSLSGLVFAQNATLKDFSGACAHHVEPYMADQAVWILSSRLQSNGSYLVKYRNAWNDIAFDVVSIPAEEACQINSGSEF